ncbi:MAG: hypothetical protein ACRERE_44525 [Candidatus Entotheonellia bacterium]
MAVRHRFLDLFAPRSVSEMSWSVKGVLVERSVNALTGLLTRVIGGL